jgi:hypothetical protein
MEADASKLNPALLGAEVESFVMTRARRRRARVFLRSRSRITKTIVLTAILKIRTKYAVGF